MERHEAYKNVMELIPAIAMTGDIIAHPHCYETELIEDWVWDKETKDKATE